MMRIDWYDPAREDLDDLVLYISKDSPLLRPAFRRAYLTRHTATERFP